MKNRKNAVIMMIMLLLLLIFCFFLFTTQMIEGMMRYVIACIGLAAVGVASYMSVYQKEYAKVVTMVVCFSLLFGIIALPYQQNRLDHFFTTPARTEITKVGFYVMKTDETSDRTLADYENAQFIVQTEVDLEHEFSAVADASSRLDGEISTVEYATVFHALEALYTGKQEVLILNEAIVDQARTLSKYRNFLNETEEIHVFTKDRNAKEVVTVKENEPFLVYVAGSFTNDVSLTASCSNEVNLLLGVNPKEKQIVLVAIPNNWYVYDQIEDGYDWLFQLGRKGISNAVNGIEKAVDLDISGYMITNVLHYRDLVDGLDGVRVENPYAFTASLSNPEYTFEKGRIDLDGRQAQAYIKERFVYENGDYDHNDHEALVMKALLEKSKQLVNEGKKEQVLKAYTSSFLTNLDYSDVYSMYSADSDINLDWDYVLYSMGGTSSLEVTVSYGEKYPQYVMKPIESQVTFIHDVLVSLLKGERVEYEMLPQE